MIKKFFFKLLLGICEFVGLGYSGIFFSKELRKLEKDLKIKKKL